MYEIMVWLLYHTKLPLLGFLKYIEYICVLVVYLYMIIYTYTLYILRTHGERVFLLLGIVL